MTIDRFKFPSIKHVPWSPSVHSDDKVHPDISVFDDLEVVILEKMDGENTTIYPDSTTHARSLNSSYHESRTRVSALAARVGYQIPEGWRICGENMQAKHSIHYKNLDDWFYVFSVFNGNNDLLTWNETEDFCEALGLTTAPLIYRGQFDLDYIRDTFTHDMLQSTSNDCVEGYVMRHAAEIDFEAFSTYHVKYVRPNHVQTSDHWMFQEITENELAEPTTHES